MSDTPATTTDAAALPPGADRNPDAAPERTDVGEIHAPIMRELREPRDGYEPVPMWLICAAGLLLFWGGWYLAAYSGDWRADVFDEDPPDRFTGAAAPPEPVDPISRGKKLFTANCVACHQAAGTGVPNQYPPLAGSEWVTGEPGRLKRILLGGLNGPVTVKGAVFNNQMPAFGERLKDDQIAAVLTFIRQEWGNAAGAITPEQVAATRAAIKGCTDPWTEKELLAVTADDAPAATAGPAAKK